MERVLAPLGPSLLHPPRIEGTDMPVLVSAEGRLVTGASAVIFPHKQPKDGTVALTLRPDTEHHLCMYWELDRRIVHAVDLADLTIRLLERSDNITIPMRLILVRASRIRFTFEEMPIVYAQYGTPKVYRYTS